jgi:hypothetical protein
LMHRIRLQEAVDLVRADDLRFDRQGSIQLFAQAPGRVLRGQEPTNRSFAIAQGFRNGMPAIENGGVDLEIRPSGLRVAATGFPVWALESRLAGLERTVAHDRWISCVDGRGHSTE